MIRSVVKSLPMAMKSEPGRIERIGEDARFADHRPAVGGEHPLAAVREVLQREEVLEPLARSASTTGALRLELAQPVDARARSGSAVQTDAASSSATMPMLVLPEPSGISQIQ